VAERSGAALLKGERQERILAALGASGRVVATELQAALDVSAYTVRRDLDELADAGRLQRVHGGALARVAGVRTATGRGRPVAGERAVGRAAAALLVPGEVAILDGGGAALALAEALPPGFAGTFVTHAPAVALALAAHAGVAVVLVGGTLDARALLAVGAQAIEAYTSVNADVLLLDVEGVDAARGLTSRTHEEAELRRVLLGRAGRVVGLATAEAIGAVAPFGYGPAGALTRLVAERGADDGALEPVRELGVEVVRTR